MKGNQTEQATCLFQEKNKNTKPLKDIDFFCKLFNRET